MLRRGLRLCTMLAVGFILSWLPESADGQAPAEPYKLDVMVFNMDAVSRSQIGTIFATMSNALADAKCPEVGFEIRSLTQVPSGTPSIIEFDEDYLLVSELDADVVVLLDIHWCPPDKKNDSTVSQESGEVSQESGEVKQYGGCSFGSGFAVAAGAANPKLVWLHEHGHVLGLKHMDESGYIMSDPERYAVGKDVTPDQCRTFQGVG